VLDPTGDAPAGLIPVLSYLHEEPGAGIVSRYLTHVRGIGTMNSSTTILPCPNCRRRLRVPTDRGDLWLTCPACRSRWDWSPRRDEVRYIGEAATGGGDPGLARALEIFEEFERQRAEASAESRQAGDLWDEWLDGPRRG
jgi:hypothetical protein